MKDSPSSLGSSSLANSSLANSRDELELSSLMKAAQAGDRDAYRRLLRRVQEMLQSFVKNSLVRMGQGGSPVGDDIIQEVLLAIHAKRDTYDPAQYFLPWMYAIGRYKLIDHLRSMKHLSKTGSLEANEAAVDWEAFKRSSTPQSEAEWDSEQLLSQLPQKQRDLLKMVKLEGLSIQEAALRTGFSPSDVKVSIHRAIKSLQKKLNINRGDKKGEN